MPGVVDNPIPIPVRTPMVKKKTCMLGATLLKMRPREQSVAPRKVTYLYDCKHHFPFSTVAKLRNQILNG